jgi:hypothetical protein
MLNHSRLKAWVQKIRGVVTCYLDSYLGWFRALDREKGNGLKPQQWLAMAISERANKMICEHSHSLILIQSPSCQLTLTPTDSSPSVFSNSEMSLNEGFLVWVN